MRTLAFCLTTCFVTLKVVDKLTWSWFWALCPLIFWVVCWVVLFIVYNAASIQERAAQIKANRKRQDEIDETNRRIKDLHHQIQATVKNDNIKAGVWMLIICGMMYMAYGCRPSGKLM